MKVQATAKLKQLRTSPRKVRLLIDLVRGMSTEEALAQLMFSKKTAALPVKKLIESAIANAVHNYEADPRTLIISKAFVDGGSTLHRWMPRAFGRASKIKKRTSHITVVVEGEAIEKKEVIKTGKVVEEKTKEKSKDKEDKK